MKGLTVLNLYSNTGTLPADSSAFGCLPFAVRDSILQQAFQQLDQRHLFGVAPRVCRLWHQLSLSLITSLEINISTEEAAEQLSLWMQNHGAVLKSFNLLLQDEMCPLRVGQSLLQSLGAANQLHSLTLCSNYEVVDVPLQHLTKLTSLNLSTCCLSTSSHNSILSLTKLNSLRLCCASMRNPLGAFIKQLSTSLLQISTLDMSGSVLNTADLKPLRKLPKLKQLAIGSIRDVDRVGQLAHLPITAITVTVNADTVNDVDIWLQDAAEHLQEFHLLRGGQEALTAPLLPLQKGPQLRSLSVHGADLNMEHLAALTQLTSFNLCNSGLEDEGLCKLSALSQLQELAISETGITGAQGSMEVLAGSLACLNSLMIEDASASVVEAANQAFALQNGICMSLQKCFIFKRRPYDAQL